MKFFDWNEEKNELLKIEREVGFEDVLIAIESGNLIDILEHPQKKEYPNQKIFAVNINNYIYLVPFVEDEEKIFLKTIIPSRKATKKYLIKGGKKMKYFELTTGERKTLEDFEKGKLVGVKDATKQKRLYQKYVQNTLNKTKNINIRLSERILAKLKAKAIEQGIPYQTLVSSVLHRFVAN